jgi:hypothetical protein
MTKNRLSPNLQVWIDARKRFRLSHAQVQMARELGMNPRKLGKLDNHDQEPWKAPLPQFIEQLYFKRFGRQRPELVMSIEGRARLQQAQKAARREAKLQAPPGWAGDSSVINQPGLIATGSDAAAVLNLSDPPR